MARPWWTPELFLEKTPYLHDRARIVAEVRGFFAARGYLEVDTPALQKAPCMEAHIQGFKTELVSADRQSRHVMYLHTSPEFAMKKLLVAGLPKIFQLAKVFRNCEGSRWHSPEFTMLEWYQAGMDYKEMMQETIDLLRHVKLAGAEKEWEIITVAAALKKYADVDISNHLPVCHSERSEESSPVKIPHCVRNDAALEYLRAEAKRINVYISGHDDWENALLKILMEKVEPKLGMEAPAIIYDYPVTMAALSRPKPEDPRYAERFEVYVRGVELANAFGELTDANVQRERFLHDVALRKKVYGEDYPVDEDFLAAIDHGLPPASGNALGIDRLVMLLTGADHIDLVQAAPVTP